MRDDRTVPVATAHRGSGRRRPAARSEPRAGAPVVAARSSATSTSTAPAPVSGVSFAPNVGQLPRGVVFQARAASRTLSLTRQGAVLSVLPLDRPGAGTVVRMRYDDSNAAAAVTPTDPLPGVVNYLLGSDPRDWRTGVRTYAASSTVPSTPGSTCPTTGVGP